ncbi:flavin reductase family protein [Mycobacterium sp. M23085]|uniref:flavin reductase family protein n=1 Tax=Mycobacterium sp. M23085 TaxID=3378087 RepID=UPI0038779689
MLVPVTRPVHGSDMRRAMGRLTTGVAVVSAGTENNICGMTIGSLTSISLEPPILMISLTHGSRTTDAVTNTGRFAISILGSRQEAVARHFATRGGARFENIDCEYGSYGLPMIKGALVQGECSMHSSYDIGDHRVFFGAVENLRYRDGTGLTFNCGRFGDFHDFGHNELPWWY